MKPPTQVTRLRCLLSALEEAESKGEHDRETIIAWALNYGSPFHVTRDEIERFLSESLGEIFKIQQPVNPESPL